MTTRKCMLAGALMLLVAISAVAQTEAPKAEITGEYSYLRFNPTLPQLNNRNFNGGGVDLSYFFLPMVGFKAELLFYGSTDFTTIFSTPFATSLGTIPAGTYVANGSMQTYQFGPIVKARYKHFEPFGQILFGISHTNAYANIEKAIAAHPGAVFTAQGSQTPFAMTVGGGIDIPIRPNLAIRAADINYMLTRFTNPLTSTNNQNNFKYSAGIQYRWGAH